jgi:hypothetical protein
MCAVSLVVFFMGAREARAQLIVTDPGNTAQNMMSVAQDFSMYLEQFADIAKNFKEYDEAYDNFKEYVALAQKITKGAKYTAEIVRTMDYFVDELSVLKETFDYFRVNGASPSVVTAAMLCYKDFAEFFGYLKDDFLTKLSFVKTMKNGDVLTALESLNKTLSEFQSQFYAADMSFMSRMRQLYGTYQRSEMLLRDAKLMTKSIF